jgi:hypothetical protein
MKVMVGIRIDLERVVCMTVFNQSIHDGFGHSRRDMKVTGPEDL